MCEISPEYLRETINNYFTSRPLRSSNGCLLAKPRIQPKAYIERIFAFAALSVWNSLSEEVRGVNLISLFKKKLKTQLSKTVFKIEEA